MDNVIENAGGRDFRSSDIIIQNQIIELLEAQLTSLGLSDHIVSGCEITANDVTSGFVFINGQIRVFEAYNDASGIPTPFECSLTTVTIQRKFLDDVTKSAIKKYNLIPDVGGAIDLRSLPTQKVAKEERLNRYISANFDGDEATLPSLGWLSLGKGGFTNISPLGEFQSRSIKSTVGDITAKGHFVGENAPKLIASVLAADTIQVTNMGSLNLGSATLTSGIYTCLLPVSVSGVIILTSNAYVVDSGVFVPCSISAWRYSDTQVQFKVTYDGSTVVPVNSASLGVYAQITAYWE